MKQIAISEPYNIEVIDVPEPKLSEPYQIKSRTKVCGISIGTELAQYRGAMVAIAEKWKKIRRKIFPFKYLLDYEFPWFPGYENVGEVVEVGRDIKDVKRGDRVVHCGQHAEYFLLPRSKFHLPVYAKIPDSVSDEDATLAILGTTALWGVQMGKVGYGENVVTLGDGVVGILSSLHAELAGANKSLLVGNHEGKLKRARQAGVKITINHHDEDWMEQVLEHTDGYGPDVVLEAVGSTLKTTSSIPEACAIVREKGRVVVVGDHFAPQTDWILMEDCHFKELTIHVSRAMGPGSHKTFLLEELNKVKEYNFVKWTTTSLFRYVIQLIEEKKLNVHPLITHRFKYTEVADVFKRLDEKKEDFIQVLLTGW